VQLVFDDEYHSATDKVNDIDAARPHDTGKVESKVHVVLEASRWIKVVPGDGGATEFAAADGHEPSAGSATATVTGSSESRSDNGTGDKNRVVSVTTETTNFSGKAAPPNVVEDDSPVSIGTPQFSELGKGLEFHIRLKVGLAGECVSKNIDEHGTRVDTDCASASSVVADGFTIKGDNPNKGAAQGISSLAELAEDLSIYPTLSPEQEKMMSTDDREKVPGVFIGSDTHGDSTAGWKTHMMRSKVVLGGSSDGTTREEIQKVDFTAQIVPGAPIANECSFKAKDGITGRHLTPSDLARYGVTDLDGLQTLKTGTGQRIEFTMSDGTLLKFAENTEAQLQPCDIGYKDTSSKVTIKLVDGKMWAQVTKAPGRQFEVTTADAFAHVKGTTFDLAYSHTYKITAAHVTEGSVEFGTFTFSGQLITIDGGKYAVTGGSYGVGGVSHTVSPPNWSVWQ
jgi:hypothetical protein